MIRDAQMTEIEYLSNLAIRSKAHWGYKPDYLEKCREITKIDEQYFNNWPVVVMEEEQSIVAFYSLKIINNENRLDNLWVEPSLIGKGFGRKLFLHAIDRAKSLGWSYFRLASEPKATQFYTKMGASQIGGIPSLLDSNLLLPHIEMKF